MNLQELREKLHEIALQLDMLKLDLKKAQDGCDFGRILDEVGKARNLMIMAIGETVRMERRAD